MVLKGTLEKMLYYSAIYILTTNNNNNNKEDTERLLIFYRLVSNCTHFKYTPKQNNNTTPTHEYHIHVLSTLKS